jgi:hypothetical protein
VSRARKILIWILVAFLLYAIFRSPNQAADIVRTAIDGIIALVRAIGQFFDALLTG